MASLRALDATEPPTDCKRCPRLVGLRRRNKKTHPDYFNGPAPNFGPQNASLLIVGLAPGLHGANRTGIPFTGDHSGDLLFATLEKFGLSNAQYGSLDNGKLRLKATMITNAVRCLPPQNKPSALEIRTCRQFLTNQIKRMTKLKAILCLGRIAHDSTLAALDVPSSSAPFRHGARHPVADAKFRVFDSYHCSRYNINTRRLTEKMFEAVFEDIKSSIMETTV